VLINSSFSGRLRAIQGSPAGTLPINGAGGAVKQFVNKFQPTPYTDYLHIVKGSVWDNEATSVKW